MTRAEQQIAIIPTDGRMLTSAELAGILAVSVQTIRDLANEGRIPGFRVARDWRFSLPEVLETLRAPEGARVR